MSTPDPYLDDVRRHLLRLARHLHRLDRGSLVQIANHADAVLDRLEDDQDRRPFSTLRRLGHVPDHLDQEDRQ